MEQDWEETILAEARGQTSTTSSDEEDDDDSAATPVLSARAAVRYLNELSDFAVAHQHPDLLECINKSKTAVENTMCDSKRIKQTKLTDYLNV